MLLGAAFFAGLWAVGIGTSAAGRPSLEMLGRLNEGRWELHRRDGSIQRLCIGDRVRLIQLRHPDSACTRIVIEDGINSVTVQYTCRGRGYGRTHIRREAGDLIQLETQGIADGFPFEFSAEGRWIGGCSP